MNLFTRKGQLH